MTGDHFSHIREQEYGFLYHYYRAEVYRETNWRTRLDVSTNWAIVVSGGILSYVFSTPEAPHSLIIMNYLIILFFLYMEARRFRYYEMLRHRTRLLEEKFLAPMFSPEKSVPDQDAAWWKELGDSLSNPRISMSRLESLAWRVRRHYLFIVLVLFFSWIARIYSSPVQAENFSEAIDQGSMLMLPGTVVFWLFFVSVAGLFFIAYQIPKASREDDLP